MRALLMARPLPYYISIEAEIAIICADQQDGLHTESIRRIYLDDRHSGSRTNYIKPTRTDHGQVPQHTTEAEMRHF